MADYLLLFRGVEDMVSEQSPSEMQAHMDRWKNWMGDLAARGKLAGGQPLDKSGKTITNKGTTITDGPFTEGPEMVSGYLIIKAGDINEAVELSKSCPVFELDGNIEIRPVQEM